MENLNVSLNLLTPRIDLIPNRERRGWRTCGENCKCDVGHETHQIITSSVGLQIIMQEYHKYPTEDNYLCKYSLAVGPESVVDVIHYLHDIDVCQLDTCPQAKNGYSLSL